MKRKEKNVVLKQAAELLDYALVNLNMPPEKAAETINVLKEIDTGMFIKHDDRKYHASIKSGAIKLERTVG